MNKPGRPSILTEREERFDGIHKTLCWLGTVSEQNRNANGSQRRIRDRRKFFFLQNNEMPGEDRVLG